MSFRVVTVLSNFKVDALSLSAVYLASDLGTRKFTSVLADVVRG